MSLDVYQTPERCKPGARVPNWDHLLALSIEDARKRPFIWGAHDCATWSFEVRHRLTGGPDHAQLWRGRYKTPRGAERVLRKLGWSSFEEGARAVLGAPLETVGLAQRGDILLGGSPKAFGICIGARAAFLAPEGLITLPLLDCHLAWRS